jgi:hypothetical protein
VLVLAKLVGLAITAFVFETTRPKLLQLRWFRWLYERVLLWLDWAHRLADPVTRRMKALLRILRPQRAGRALRLLRRIRRRMRDGADAALRADAPRGARTIQSP